MANILFSGRLCLFNRSLQQVSEPGALPGSLERREMKRKGCLALLIYCGLTKQFKLIVLNTYKLSLLLSSFCKFYCYSVWVLAHNDFC